MTAWNEVRRAERGSIRPGCGCAIAGSIFGFVVSAALVVLLLIGTLTNPDPDGSRGVSATELVVYAVLIFVGVIGGGVVAQSISLFTKRIRALYF